jgi:hypothetical protein
MRPSLVEWSGKFRAFDPDGHPERLLSTQADFGGWKMILINSARKFQESIVE